jgi:hypothetical protein
VLFVYGLIALALLVYCVLDIATTPRAAVRGLPKPVWFLLVLPPLVGPAAWFLAGRPSRGTARQPLRSAPAAEPRRPDDDEDFLRELRRRADEQRRRARDPRED